MLQIRKSATRGLAEHGWLSSRHTFSFANYYDPRYVSFGPLRVINEDKVIGGQGFGTLGEVNKGNVEEVEMRFPWRCLRWELAQDTCGAGKWRGAAGIHWQYENIGTEAGMATGSSDGERVRAPGALGGEPTPNSKAFLIRQGETSRIHSHRMYQLKPGDVIHKISGGGAGVGEPAERDPEKVRWDVINEFISIDKARDAYKVVINPETLQVDSEQTRKLRHDGAGAKEAAAKAP